MSNKRKFLIVLSWTLVIACMITIFMLSAQPAVKSSEASGSCIQWIYDLFGISLSQHFVRKTAHALEFCGLCLLFNLAFGATTLKFKPFISFILTVLYAVSDEIHQIFVDGRACMFKDVLIDSGGAAVCIIVLSIVYLIYKKHCGKRGKVCQF